MTILAQMPGERPFSCFSEEDHTPQVTPRATPRPSLRTSIRAISSMSGLKSLNPATRHFERSQSSQFIRSQKVTSLGSSQRQPIQKTVMVEVHGDRRPAVNQDRVNDSVNDIDKSDSMSKTLQSGTTQEVSLKSSLEEMDSKHSQTLSVDNETDGYEFPVSKSEQNGAVNENSDFDPYARRGTPVSMTSALSAESRVTYFFDLVDTFYFVCPQLGNEADFNHKNHELFQLVEQCFQKKITPEYIVKIMYSRRKQDSKAREFIRRCPAHLIERIKYEIYHEEVSTCVSS